MELRTLGWRKSSRSAGQGGNCVELANVPGVVAVRDSKSPDGPVLLMERHEFRQVTNAIKRF
ncbi:hypothetical protein GCM10009678_83340 [Actinomadura kijaniata]|uniref:DUF397 domain-containing protein n=1 Tax=Actinomadura namibiensis TaxID=182080 RepID=A0A7W3QR82_ACTNM|nr:DUF397 domain-containing protein [Actinomadura namibiensis]MBA8956337.1 hypothetical protein [Actinomadura namibiensis]